MTDRKPRVTKCRRCRTHWTVTDGARATDRATWDEALAHANGIARARAYARHLATAQVPA